MKSKRTNIAETAQLKFQRALRIEEDYRLYALSNRTKELKQAEKMNSVINRSVADKRTRGGKYWDKVKDEVDRRERKKFLGPTWGRNR